MSFSPIHLSIVEKLDGFFHSRKIPHIIFHGSSGTGKRTLVYDFLNKIYDGDKHRLKTNVMIVNCAHGKGIKFIREELKFFAKTNIQANQGTHFKSIVLLNADSLTIDAQSALRRCIELFSHTTRFFIVVENKDKLLNPICSRFCEIYVPEYIVNSTVQNLHTLTTTKTGERENTAKGSLIDECMNKICEWKKMRNSDEIVPTNIHILLVDYANSLYDGAYNTIDVIQWISNANVIGVWTEYEIANTCMCFEKIKSEYRCEKMLLFFMMDFLVLRANQNLKLL